MDNLDGQRARTSPRRRTASPPSPTSTCSGFDFGKTHDDPRHPARPVRELLLPAAAAASPSSSWSSSGSTTAGSAAAGSPSARTRRRPRRWASTSSGSSCSPSPAARSSPAWPARSRPTVDVSVTPDQYVFLESAFLLAAVVLGGMGTVLGSVLVGRRCSSAAREAARSSTTTGCCIFGLLLDPHDAVPPGGPDRRASAAQLEFHEEDARARPSALEETQPDRQDGGDRHDRTPPSRDAPARPAGEPSSTASGVTMRFGGLTRRRHVDLAGARGRDRRPHRAQRRRQDDLLQLPHRAVRADRGPGHASTAPCCRRSRCTVVTARAWPGPSRTSGCSRNMTALENVMVGRHCRTQQGPLSSIVRGPKFRREEAGDPGARAGAARLRRAGRHDRATWPATCPTATSAGWRSPGRWPPTRQLLLLDEPTAGMNPQETRQAEELIFAIRDRASPSSSSSTTCGSSSPCATGCSAWSRARSWSRGRPAEVQSDPRVIEAYIGARAPRSDAEPSAAADEPTARRRARSDRDARGPRPPGRLRQDRGRQGHPLRRRGGPGRHPDRHQRRRQDHDAAHHLRPAARRQSGAITFQGKPIDGIAAHEIVALGARPLPRGPADLPAADRRGEPACWAPSPARTRPAIREGPGARRTTLFPILGERRAQAAGTFSGGEQQMLAMGRAMMSRPEAAHARRAVDGPVAADDAADHVDDRRAAVRRARRSCWSSRTPRPRCRWPTRATCSRSARSSCGARARSCSPTRTCARPTSARTRAWQRPAGT